MKNALSEYPPTTIEGPVKSLAQLAAFNNAHENIPFAKGKVPYSGGDTLVHHH
jgi:hypothetical protein